MTAEIAVMNRMGVALAADSAVTIGSEAQKIYTSAEKLFQLSEAAPVGIMVYGNAGYVSLPWETTIKAFRRKLGDAPRRTIADYASEFVSFLRDNPELFPEANRFHVMRELVLGAFAAVRAKRKELLDNKRKQKKNGGGGGLTPDEISPALGEAIQDLIDFVKTSPEVEGMDAQLRDKVAEWLRGSVAHMAEQTLEGIEMPDGTEAKLVELCVEYLTRQMLQSYTSGIVIAGFGSEEYMPSLATFEVEECVGILPRMTSLKQTAITPGERPAYIMPYAQQDSVLHFLLGVDTDLSEFMSDSVREMTRGLVDVVMNKVAEADTDLAAKLGDPVRAVVQEKLEELFAAWEQEQSRYYRPVLNTVAILPKDELAAMAEAFVNLTKFRRRVTPVPETVSGPIDVAVITKGDGFVWIRRKHYFSPDINPRVMARLHHPGGRS